MSRIFSANTDHLDSSSVTLTDTPCTISAWIKINSGGATVVVSIGSAGTSNNALNLATNFSTATVSLATEVDTTGASATSSQGRTTGDASNWHLIVAVFTNHSSRAAFWEGGAKSTSAVAKTASGFSAVRVSGDLSATPGSPFSGRIAHVGIWNSALSDSDVASLKYLYPNQVSVANLINYWPLTNNQSPEPDYGSGNLPLTVTGTTFSTDNPNIAGIAQHTLMGGSAG